MHSLISIFFIFLKLGCISFGGPVAHLGVFHREFVDKRKWLTLEEFSELVAISQILPGPASSQVSMALGHLKLPYFGAIASWIGFTLPSVIILITLFILSAYIPDHFHLPMILKLIALFFISKAIYAMVKKYLTSKTEIIIFLFSCLLYPIFKNFYLQFVTISFGAFTGIIFLRHKTKDINSHLHFKFSSFWSSLSILLFFGLMITPAFINNRDWKILSEFYQTGSLVFGGGHVILPLLKISVVDTTLISNSDFMTGYGLAQLMPGPLFSFTALLGHILNLFDNKTLSAFLTLLAAYLPSFLLIFGFFPIWNRLKKYKLFLWAISGVNISVLALLSLSVLHLFLKN